MKKTIPAAVRWLLFIGTAGVYLLLNLLDAGTLWQNLFEQTGTFNTHLHAVLTLGCGLSDTTMYTPLMTFITEFGLTGGLLHRFGLTLPGLLLLFPAAGALLCRAAGWRLPATLLAAFNLLLHLMMLIAIWGMPAVFMLLWCASAAGGVLLLLSCLGISGGKPLRIAMSLLALISLTATAALVFFRLSLNGSDLTLVSRPALGQALFGWAWPRYASNLWPLSRAAWFLFLLAGMALPTPAAQSRRRAGAAEHPERI